MYICLNYEINTVIDKCIIYNDRSALHRNVAVMKTHWRKLIKIIKIKCNSIMNIK